MKDILDQVRRLLDELETHAVSSDDEPQFSEVFDLFELPAIMSAVVDYLQPVLHPYEAAAYWHMLRHAIIETGDVYVRVSVNRLARSIIKSSSGQSDHLSQTAVRETLLGLEAKKAISKVGDTNREGTVYRVFLPEEIPVCQERMAALQEEQLPQVDPRHELDYYNIKENRAKVFERDSYRCKYCDKQLTRFSATLDHIQPVSEGGIHSYDNLVTSCLLCNSRRGAKTVMEAIISGEGERMRRD